ESWSRAGDKPAEGSSEAGEAAERLAHRRHLVDAVGLAHAAGEADDQPHLGPGAGVGLLVLINVGRRLDIDAARPGAVVVQKNPLPRNLDAVAHQHRVVLVEAVAE